jgi:hypothetical protein
MRYVVFAFALCLLVVSAYAGTYVENFDDGDYDGWEIFDGGEPGSKWTVEDGVLTCRREIVWGTAAIFGKEDLRNCTIEFDAKLVEPLAELYAIGFELRLADADSAESFDSVWCIASFAWQEAWIWPWFNGEEAGGSEHKTVDLNLGRWYRFKGVAHEDTFEFYIDGRFVASLTDPRFSMGRVDLIANGCVAQFDNVIITGDDVPDNTDSLVEGDLLAAMYWFEEAWRVKNADLLFSIFTDDAMFDSIPYPPMNLEEDIPFVEWYMETYPTLYVLDEGFRKASVKDGVGFMEHTDVSIWPDNGAPIEEFHICQLDFRGPKAKRLTLYGDWGTSLIQAGVMPPRNLGDTIPSFPLPSPEGTGLASMEASAELIARLNSHDLSSVAKMLRRDVDVWFPFIGRPANRREFIDIHEQLLGGFSDMSWENVRRVDMDDGWVFSEVKLIGTNDGEFLGKQATGLPMEVRSGLIEHYDEEGLATYVHFHFDTLSVPGQEAPTGPVEDFSNVFFIDLAQGLNMVSLPLKPQAPYTASSLAEEIGATVVIKYDEAQGRFVGFTSGSPGDGFPIEGGKGYIVNCLEGKTHTFAGAAWTNEPSAEAAPPASMDSAWAFVVSGSLIDSKDGNYSVTVRNLRTGDTFTGSVSGGYFAAAHADLSRRPVIEAGDRIEVAVLDSSGELVSGPYIHEVTLEGIRNAAVNVRLRMGHIIPEKSALLQNYPNPFNPETWIPFHLKNEASVSVRIYSINGRLIRSLDMGHRDAGIYVSRSDAAYWDGKNESGEEVASGIYYYTIDAGDFYATRKMIVRK